MSQSGRDSFRSTLTGGNDNFRSILAGGSDSFRSTLDRGSDSFRSALAGGSDCYMSNLAGGRDSLRSAFEGGLDVIYEQCCDLCGLDGLQKEAVGFCVNCKEYLCTECFSTHLRPKPCRNHVLLDQHKMPSREAMKTRTQHVMELQVSSKDDSETPLITGCVALPGDKLVVVDCDNDKVKLINLTHHNIVSQLKLPGKLWDITKVDCKQVAVTSYTSPKIYVVNVKANKLKLDHTIKIKGQCWGIAITNDKCVVSYENPVKVEIINMQGKLLHTVVNVEKGNELFVSPRHVAVSRVKQAIYISDFNRATVTRVDLTGEVQATYKDDNLTEPRGLTVDSAGRVYVCGWSSWNILQLTADLTDAHELLQESDGIEWPSFVYYCEAIDKLYNVMWNSNTVNAYQLE